MVVGTDTYYACSAWRINHFNPRFCSSAIHLCNILNWFDLATAVYLWWVVVAVQMLAMKKEKISIKKKKKRIPLPQKPPKIENSKDAYDRNKEKERIRKSTSED